MPKILTNQQLLTKLKTRLPNFTYEELHALIEIIEPAQKEYYKLSKIIIQRLNCDEYYSEAENYF
jgi:hypothetical protein